MNMIRLCKTGTARWWTERVRFSLLIPVFFISIQLTYAGPETNLAVSPALHSQEDTASALQIDRELARRQQAVAQIRDEMGQYHPALIEAHESLAGFYQEHDEFEQAATHYRQAFQLTRISAGLDADSQLRYLEKLIVSLLSMENWQQADEMIHLRFYLKNRIIEPADSKYVAAIAELGEWKIRLLRENLLNEGQREMGQMAQELSGLYRNSINQVMQNPDYDETVLVSLYQGKSRAALEVARVLAEMPIQYFQGAVDPYIDQRVCRNVDQVRRGNARNCTNVRQQNPLYPESQRQSKRTLVLQSVRELQDSLDSLNQILSRNPQFLASDGGALKSDLDELYSRFSDFKTTAFADCCMSESPLAYR